MVDVLVFGAHPDDAEFGMGASITKFIAQGKSVAICVLTKGESGSHGTPDVREQEMIAAAKHVGAEIEILDFADCQVVDTYENRVRIVNVIRKYQPKIIFSPYHANPGSYKDGSAHPDHIGCGQLVRFATRYARFKNLKDAQGEICKVKHLLYYMIGKGVTPTIVNDVTDYVEEWKAFAEKHVTQLALRDGNVLDYLTDMRKANGMRYGMQYAEVFVSDDPMPLDIISLME